MSIKPTIAIFASDKGSGDSERSAIMSQTGSFLAAKGVSFVCLAQNGTLCTPLITSVRSAGANIKIIADDEFILPKKLNDIELERYGDEQNRYLRLGELSNAFIGLPGSLLSIKSLFEAWVATNRKLPVLLLNKNKNFEFMRGFAMDIIAHKVKSPEKYISHADNIEDLYNRLQKLV